jgi:serine/threonine-protein kinase
MRPRVIALALSLSLLAAGGAALAQPAPDARAAAAVLFEDGKRLMAEGKHAEACPKLAESQRIDPGAGTLYNLSLCYEAIGRTASAWVGFRDVAAMAMNAGQAEREKVARGKAAALEPKLMRLKVTVQPAAQSAGAEVKRDGAVIAPALWGAAVPLDPGKHVISASAPGREPWEVTVVLDQAGNTVTVDVPPLLEKKGGAVAPPPPPPPTDTPPPPPVKPPPSETPAPRPWQRPLGIAATSVGAVGLGLGVAFGFMAKSAFNASNAPGGGCSAATDVCTQAGLDQRSNAVMKGNVGTGVFVAGAVLAAGGVVLWATAPSAPAQVGLGPGSIAVRGRF